VPSDSARGKLKQVSNRNLNPILNVDLGRNLDRASTDYDQDDD
jgi:hypothetical protein